MPSPLTSTRHASEPGAAGSFARRLREIGMFFEGNDPIHQTMRRVAARLDAASIPYAIVGGMAVNAHRHARTTKDVDFLLSAEGLAAFRQAVAEGAFEATPGRAVEEPPAPPPPRRDPPSGG